MMNTSQPSPTVSPGVRGRILVADDNRDSRDILAACLQEAGYRVETALDADETMVKALAHRPDLFLLDVLMPRKNGLDLCRELRANPVLKDVPIILITGLNSKIDKFKGIEAGCDEFLTKPVERGELIARVQTLLRLHAYRSQLHERKTFETVLNHISDGIMVLDANGRIATLNAAAAQLLNLDLERARGLVLLDWLFRVFQVSVPRQMLAKPEKSFSFEFSRPEQANSSTLFLSANLDVIPLANGGTAGSVWTLRDITKTKKETKLHRTFLSLISHKLRTPISVISEHVSLLQDGLLGELAPDQHGSIDRVADQATRLKELVDKMLQFVQIDEEVWDHAAEAFVLTDRIKEAVARALGRHPDKKTAVQYELPDGLYGLGISTENFQRIVESLADNAVKFGDKPTMELKVGYRESKDGERELYLSDNGPGIASEEFEKIFEEFYQIDKYFTGNVAGVGLGLALVRRLIERAGGRIWVTSDLGKGATFHFTLPVIGTVLRDAA